MGRETPKLQWYYCPTLGPASITDLWSPGVKVGEELLRSGATVVLCQRRYPLAVDGSLLGLFPTVKHS
jgi:hypothetical protein